MDQLHFEILSAIFVLHFPIPPCTLHFRSLYPRRAQELNLLLSVSRRWNDAIVNTPELWSYIELSDKWRNPRPLLERSKAVPLHVRIEFGTQSGESWIEGVKAVWTSADRWKTYAGYVSSYTDMSATSLQLLPPCTLPIVEEVCLHGYVRDKKHFIQAPRLSKLVDYSSIFGIADAPNLKSWHIEFPRGRSEWERMLEVIQLCPLLESLVFLYTGSRSLPMVESGFTQLADHITFPALKKLVMDSRTPRFDFFPYIRAPRLERIVVQHSREFMPFTLPLPASCPSLSRIQFVGGANLDSIQAWVPTLPKETSERVSVEIEYCRKRNACGVYEPVNPEFDSRWRKWFDENFPVKWIPVNVP